ncbi:MAG: ergothioneine biosynthesis glutamate--cysteine ligase EgtA [Mycobacteriales bacterium]
MIDALTADYRAPLTEESAASYVGGTCFKTGPPELVGVELEWLVHDAARPHDPVPADRLATTLTDPFDPPLAGLLSTEPGGQLELSSPPAPLAECLAVTSADLARLRDRLTAAGLGLAGIGLDPVRPPVRVSDSPRYVAMQHQFDRRGPEGRVMMCSTASVQVCLDAGREERDLAERWHALHAWVPVLVAMFAHSPLAGGRPTGWRAARLKVWTEIDPSRTRAPAGQEPRRAYAAWALDAELLAVRRRGAAWATPVGLTFRAWLRGSGPGWLAAPTVDDLDFHLSTLFPPVRARGHLELRVVDAQPRDDWRVVTALVAGLLDDPAARAEATALAAGAEAEAAARRGLADPHLARAAVGFTAAAAAALDRAGHRDLADEVTEWAGRYPARGRTPADDLLDGWRRQGTGSIPGSIPGPIPGPVPRYEEAW